MADIPVRVIIDAIDNASNKLKQVGGSMNDLAGNMQTVGAVGLAVGGATALLTKGFIEQAGQMEQNEIAFATMLGSATKAKTLLEEMQMFAAATPFAMPDIVNAGKQLLAFGFAQKEVIGTTEMLGNVAAGLNIPIGDIIYLFGTLRAQGRAYTKDIAQFTARGIPILDELAKQYGVTTNEVYKLIETGKVGFPDVEKAFKSMTGESGMFFNLMQRQSKSTLGTWSNLQDSFTRTQIAIGEALLPAVNDLMNAIMPMVTAFSEWARQNPEIVKGLVVAGLVIGALGAVLFTVGAMIAPIVATFALLGSAVTGFGIALGAVSAAIAFIVSPIGLVILAVVAVIAVIALLTAAWQGNWFNIQGIVAAAGQMIGQAITGIVNFFIGLANFIVTLPAIFDAFVESLKMGIYTFFVETLPFALGFAVMSLINFLTIDLPMFVVGVIQWFQNLRTTLPALIQQMAYNVITWFDNMLLNVTIKVLEIYRNVVQWFTKTYNDAMDAIYYLPDTVSAVFSEATQAAINKAKEMYDGVKKWFDGVIGFFKDIYNWAGKALDKANEAFMAGAKQGNKGRQFGGPVSLATGYTVGEVGPEAFTPQVAGYITPHGKYAGKGNGGGPGTTIQFIINSDMIINSPTERRSLAEALYKDLATLARSQNMTVAELMGA